ncbi:hypothetical protein ACA910_012751 [Epithemia clementina (nom. ined.)]
MKAGQRCLLALFLLVTVTLPDAVTDSFSVDRASLNARQRRSALERSPASLLPWSPSFLPSGSQHHYCSLPIMWARPKEGSDDSVPRKADPLGLKRGSYLLGLSLFLAIWIFSIPPEFRRARFCPNEECAVTHCFECVTPSEWVGGIVEYYQNGGGVQFDFSIDQSTKDYWAGNP